MNRESIKALLKRSPLIKRLHKKYTNLISAGHAIFDWSPFRKLIEQSEATNRSKNSRRVLLGTVTGKHLVALNIENLVGAALRIRGHQVHALVCDGILPACLMCEYGLVSNMRSFVKKGARSYFCSGCQESAYQAYGSSGVTIHKISECLTDTDIAQARDIAAKTSYADIPGLEVDGIPVGQHAKSGALRFFAKSSLGGEQYAEQVMRLYIESAIMVMKAVNNLNQRIGFNASMFHHGIYVPHGVIGEVLRRDGVPVVNWNAGYRKGTFLFSHGNTYHYTMLDEDTKTWESMELNQEKKTQLTNYMASRTKGTRDWHAFLRNPSEKVELPGLDASKPTVALLTNVCWDAQLHYPSNVYNTMLDWIFDTIEYFIERQDLQLVIRIHPAEITGDIPSRERVDSAIAERFKNLPGNIFVVSPESNLSTYKLIELSNTTIIYGTKTGVEVALMGKSLIVAGEAWIRNKGLSMDVTSRAQYHDLLDQLPYSRTLGNDHAERASKYAYHFFFDKMIPLDMVVADVGWPPFRIEIQGIDNLVPGASQGLDVICDGIVYGKEFLCRTCSDTK